MNSGINIILQHSKYLAYWITALIGFALVCVFYALPWMVAILFVPAIIWYGYHGLQQHAWRKSSNAIVAMHCLTDPQQWILHTRNTRWRVRYQGSAFRSRFLCIASFIRLKDKRTLTVLIPKDAIAPQLYSSLLARLWF